MYTPIKLLAAIFGFSLLLVSPSSAAVCQSEECKAAAAEIGNNLDESVDPCDDFYLYACGGLTKKGNLMSLFTIQEELQRRLATVLDDDNVKNHGSKAVRKVKQIYDDCRGKSDAEIDKMYREMKLKNRLNKILGLSTFFPHSWEKMNPKKLTNDQKCQVKAQADYPYAFDRVYIDKYFPKEDHENVRKMVSNIRQTYVNTIVDKITWLDASTKESLLGELNQLNLRTGYPEWVGIDSELDSEYGANFNSTLIPHEKWQMDPLIVNAWFDGTSVTIPAGILLPIVYSGKLPNYLNYGGAGFVSGHEISHGIHVWTEGNTDGRRGDALDCISDQLTSFKDPTTGKSIWFAFLYINEMLADVGGINASLTAYREVSKFMEDEQLPGLEKLTNEQLFFLSQANTWCINPNNLFSLQMKNAPFPINIHPPSYYRVVIPAMNSPDFARAFNCKAGTFMNPVKKCKLW